MGLAMVSYCPFYIGFSGHVPDDVRVREIILSFAGFFEISLHVRRKRKPSQDILKVLYISQKWQSFCSISSRRSFVP